MRVGEASAYERGSALPFVDSSDIDGPALRVLPRDIPSSCSSVMVHFPGLRRLIVALSDKLRRYFRMNVSI